MAYNTGGGNATGVGIYSSRPAAGTKGNSYYDTTGGVRFVDNGTIWQPDLQGYLGTETPSSGWTTFQSGTPTSFAVSKLGGTIYMATTPSNNMVGFTFAKPGATYTATAGYQHTPGFDPSAPAQYMAGLAITDGTKYITMSAFTSGSAPQSFGITFTHWNTAGTVTATFVGPAYTYIGPGNLLWMRIINDGSQRFYQISSNGISWVPLFSESNSTFITTETRVGMFQYTPSIEPMDLTLYSWSFTSP